MGSQSGRAVKSAASQANASPVMRGLARAGFAMTGLLHLILGWLVIRMGTSGSDQGEASQSGVLDEIAAQPFGPAVLGVVAAGLGALALWHILNIIRPIGARERLKAAGKAVIYLALAVLAARFALGMGGGGEDEESLTRTAMSYPAGRIAIAAVAAGIAVGGIVHLYIGWKKTFKEGLRPSRQGAVNRAVVAVGRLGYGAKGLALMVLGGLFGFAAWTSNPEEAGGLDEAFATIGAQPFGSVLLIVTGVGIACFGLFCFAQARYQQL